MTFDPAVADAAYPDRMLRFAAFSNDPDRALDAARDWIAAVDPEAITYPQHRMIARMMMRQEGRLEDGPLVQRLRGVRRQLWTRAKVNLALLGPALADLGGLGGDVLVIGTGAALARGARWAADGFDVADLVVRGRSQEAAVAHLTAAGWTIAPVQAETWQKARTLWLSRPPSGRLRLHRPRAFGGIDPLSLFVGTEAGDLPGAGPVTLPASSVVLRLALSQAMEGRSVTDQWLFDLANAGDMPGGADLLREVFAAEDEWAASGLRDWLDREAGLTF
ncbi:MAG: hypothetical protein JJT81_14495 [Rubellimicrobium sp.]|nr:hypothetical protein [Rubellimicrobium sp.]